MLLRTTSRICSTQKWRWIRKVKEFLSLISSGNKLFEDVQDHQKAYILENNNWSDGLFDSSATFGSYRTNSTHHPLPEKFASVISERKIKHNNEIRIYKHANIKGSKERLDDCNNPRISNHYEIKIFTPEFNKISEYSNFPSKINFIRNSKIKKNQSTSNAFDEEKFDAETDGQGRENLIYSRASSIHQIMKQE